jgi:hypothetical protein
MTTLSSDLSRSLATLREAILEKDSREARVAYLERSISYIKARHKKGTTRDAMLADHHLRLAQIYQGTPQ